MAKGDTVMYFIGRTKADGYELFRYNGSRLTRCTNLMPGQGNGALVMRSSLSSTR